MKRPESFDERFTHFEDVASSDMAKWPFVIVSALLIVAWTFYAAHNFGRDWFTSNAFNFPLNTVTTLGEWFIGAFGAGATMLSLRTILNQFRAVISNQRLILTELKRLQEDDA